MRLAPCLASMAVGVVTVAGCEESTPAPGTFTVRDSAGVEIVTSPTPAWSPEESWTLSRAPELSIGEVAGEDDYTLYRVRAALRLSDGRVAIANGGTSQVRIYDSEGRHLENLGRLGEGPGEFTILIDLWRGLSDSIVAADLRPSRLTVFDAEGELGRTIPLQQSDTPRQLFGRGTLDTGDLLVSGALPSEETPRVGLFDGGIREFDRYSPQGRPMNRIGSARQGRNWGFDTGNPYGPSYTSAPFENFSPPNTTDGEAVFLGDGTVAEVEQRSSQGGLMRLIRWGVEPRPVTPDLEDGFRAMRLDVSEQFRSSAIAMLDGLVFPEYLPVYETLKTDTEGFLWVKPYHPDWEPGGPWWVFDDTGRWLGGVDIPTDLNVFDIGADYVLGLVRDDQDVERVVMYGLHRGDGS